MLVPAFARQLHSLTLRTVPAAPATLRDERTLHAVVLRNETLVTAPADGTFVLLAKEESRVRKGESVGLLVTENDQHVVRAPSAGVVRLHWDGWGEALHAEGVWRRAPLGWKERADGDDRTDVKKTPDDGAVEADAPVLRLVDSHSMRLYADLPRGAGWRPGQRVTFTMPDVSAEPLQARIIATGSTNEADEPVALLELARYVPVLDAVRHVDLTVVLASHEGVVVPAAAIVWDDGAAGVLVQRNGKARFVPVRVVARVGDEIALAGIPLGEKIVINPERIGSW